MRNKLYIKYISLTGLKNLYLLLFFLTAFVSFGFSQNDAISQQKSNMGAIETAETNVLEDSLISDSDTEKVKVPIDTNIIEVGNKLFIFIEYQEGMVIDRVDLKTGEKKRILDFDCKDCDSPKDTLKFRGNWSGIEFGINEFVNSDFSMKRPDGYEFMDLNSWRSWNVNINFSQSTTPLIKNRLALVGGLGLEMNHYFFEDNNNIQLNDITGVIEEREFTDLNNIRKSKFNTMYLTTPVLLEIQFGKGNSKDRFYISGGVVGGLKIASKVKLVYGEKGERKKLTEQGDDLNLNRWRLGLTARIGYKDYFNFYANYYLTPFFEKDKGPELYPFTLGCRIDFTK